MPKHKHGNARAAGLQAGMPSFQLSCNPFYDLHRVVCVKSLPVAGRSRFASHLAIYFPTAVARIEEQDFGCLHLEAGALKLETRDAIARRDWDAVASHFAFVSEMMDEGGAELRDALRVSYLGNLFYGEITLNYAKARSMLPKLLARELEAVESHWESLEP